ncbi:MAG: hypothetical protein AB3N14_21260 [Flavobacteriaceae bacterium]
MKHWPLCLLFVGLISSCSENPQKKAQVLQELNSPAAAGSGMPFLYSDGNQTLLSWVEKQGDSLAILKYSELSNESWKPAREVMRGTDWFVNWADFPVITANNGHLFTHVLKKSSAGTYSYDVRFNLLAKDERSWRTDLPLHQDNTPTEHGFVTALPYEDGFFVNWLDGRNTVENEAGERGAMTIRAATLNLLGEIVTDTLLDARTCDCCQTTAAITTNGPVVIYRDRSEDEIRDISIVRQLAGKWTTPKPIFEDHWKINGCPVNGPKAAAMENALVVAWFTAAEDSAKIKLAFSDDGGANFDNPIIVSDSKPMGRVDVALIDKETAVVSWMESKDKKADLNVVQLSREGARSKIHTITSVSAARASGFPQMELVRDKFYFAWTAINDSTSIVKTAFIKTSDL